MASGAATAISAIDQTSSSYSCITCLGRHQNWTLVRESFENSGQGDGDDGESDERRAVLAKNPERRKGRSAAQSQNPRASQLRSRDELLPPKSRARPRVREGLQRHEGRGLGRLFDAEQFPNSW